MQEYCTSHILNERRTFEGAVGQLKWISGSN